jgi:hypothetical protein
MESATERASRPPAPVALAKFGDRSCSLCSVCLGKKKGNAMETKAALEAYSRGDMSAIEPRYRLGGAPYGEVLGLLSEHNLPLPRAPTAGRDEQIERARNWLFPKHVA